MQRSFTVPPGGFVGASQQTQAGQVALLGSRGFSNGSRRRRKRNSTAKRKRTAKKRSARSSSRGKKNRLVKGSAAARRYMARLRKMRK